MPRRWKAVIFLTTLLAATLRRRVTPSDRLEPVEAHHRAAHQHEREPPPRIPVPRTCSRLKQLSHDSERSTFQRWRPSLADDSTCRRAIRALIPRRRRYERLARLS
jgi:hypothetical protein